MASRLRNSTKEERKHLYNSLYDELYSKITYLKNRKTQHQPDAIASIILQKIKFIKHFLKPEIIFLEVGSGDCRLSIEVAQYVQKVYAIDVSLAANKIANAPSNFELIISDGISIPVPENTVGVVYSDQLMEHVHPDDAIEQLQNIYRALAAGGIYICITPNRLSGPHDISMFFDDVATGFHLKEYTITELYQLFKQVGFSQVSLYKKIKNNDLKIPLNTLNIQIFKVLESVLLMLPTSLRTSIVSMSLFFRGITMVAQKG